MRKIIKNQLFSTMQLNQLINYIFKLSLWTDESPN